MEPSIIQPISLSVAISIIVLYITIKVSVITAVGDLKRIRSHAETVAKQAENQPILS